MTEIKVTKKHHILLDKNERNKVTKTQDGANSTVQYSGSYKSMHSIVPKNNTKTKTISLII